MTMIVSKIVMILMMMIMMMAMMNDVGSNDDKMMMTRRSNDGDNENKKLWYLLLGLINLSFADFLPDLNFYDQIYLFYVKKWIFLDTVLNDYNHVRDSNV